MNFKKCVYYVEGECEEQFINALKLEPRRLIPGKVVVFNIIQNELPRREILKIDQGTTVVFVFDTDKEKTDVLKDNICRVQTYVERVKIVSIAEVRTFEDELVRATDLKKAEELTRSKTVSDFKRDFRQMKTPACRDALERHKMDVSKLWVKPAPEPFDFVKQGGDMVKI